MKIFEMIGRKAAKETLEKAVPAMVHAEIVRQIDRRMPAMIEEVLADLFRRKPDAHLTEVGFNWALYLSLRELWPCVSSIESVRWLREYIEIPYGTAGYDWTANAAKLIASEYVNEVGEIA